MDRKTVSHYWSYDFQRYVDYMARNGLDAVVASNYSATARMLDYYYKSDFYESIGLKEENAFVGCDRQGKVICAYAKTMEQGMELLVSLLKKRGLDRGVIGLEMMDLPALGLRALSDNLPGAALVDASWVIHQDLARKTEREIALIQRSVAASEAGFRCMLEHLREYRGAPVSDLIWKCYVPEVIKHGAEMLFSNASARAWQRRSPRELTNDPAEYKSVINQLGEHFTGYPKNQLSWRYFGHTEPVVTETCPYIFDLICAFQGLDSDISFRAAIGQPDADFLRNLEKSGLVIKILLGSVKPGKSAAEVEAACLEGIRKTVGAWDEYWAIHGTGLLVHEFPLVGSSYPGRFGDYIFEAGNVLCFETFGMEQMFVLRADGMHRLGEMPLKIYCV